MIKKKIIKLALSYPVLLVFLSIVLISLFFQRDFLIYRDFAIIWNGALLVAEGYRPWEDFIMPISPLSIYFVGLFLSLTEKTWLALQIFQIIMNCFLLSLVAVFLIKFERNKILIFISLSIFTFFYLILLTHPWYNNFGAFFLLLCIFLVNYQSKILIFISGIISALTIFIKLDFGLMAILSGVAIICNQFFCSDKRLFFLNILIFFLGVLSFLLLFISLYEEEVLHQSIQIMLNISENRYLRLERLFEIKNLILLSIGLWCIFFVSKYKKHFVSYGLIILSSFATSIFGGIEHTHNYYVFALFPIIYICFKQRAINKHLFVIIPMIIYLAIPMVRLNIHIVENYFTKSYESEYFNKRNISDRAEIIKLELCSDNLKNIYGPKDFCDLKELIESKAKILKNTKGHILNLTEVNFLNTMLGFEPQKFHPVWYKVGQTINGKFKDSIFQEIQNGDYKIILIQTMPKNYSGGFYRDEMIDFLRQNKTFTEVNVVYESPMCLVGERLIKECGIHVFIKNLTASSKKIYH